MTVLSTVTVIVWTHQLYSCHNTAAGCWVIQHFNNALCLASATSTIHTAAFYLMFWQVIGSMCKWAAQQKQGKMARSPIQHQHGSVASSRCSCCPCLPHCVCGYCTPEGAAQIRPAYGFLHNHCPNSKLFYKSFFF